MGPLTPILRSGLITFARRAERRAVYRCRYFLSREGISGIVTVPSMAVRFHGLGFNAVADPVNSLS
jgi:hypothetical protein